MQELRGCAGKISPPLRGFIFGVKIVFIITPRLRRWWNQYCITNKSFP